MATATMYAQGDITVDRDFARFGQKAYAINKINTVEVRTQPASKAPAILLAAIGAIAVLVSLSSDDGPGAGLVIGLLMIVAGVLIFRKARDTYRLYLMTSSSEVQAFETQDLQQVTDLRRAVESAMIALR